MFGRRESCVPLDEATLRDEKIVVPHDKDRITDAPNVDVDHGHLSVSEEAELYAYHGRDYAERANRQVSTEEESAGA
jgi:hypothetical protein